MVEAEEVPEFFRVVGAAFHGVEKSELAVDQGLAAPGQVDEHPGDTVGEFGTFDGGVEGRAVHRVQRLTDLSDLVVGHPAGRCLGAYVDLLAGAQTPHGVGQFAPGDVERAVAKPHEFDDEPASDPHGDHQRGRDCEESQQHGRCRRAEQGARDRIGPAGGALAGRRLDGTQLRAYGGRVPLPGRDGHRLRAAPGRYGEHGVLGRFESRVAVASGELAPRLAPGTGQVRAGRVGEGPAGRNGAGERAQSFRVERALRCGRCQQ